MKAKIYSKKKLLSLLILPFVAGNITAKSTLAADNIDNPGSGETVNVTGINDSYRIFTYDSQVTVTLNAAAQINNDDSGYDYYPAVHLGTDATVNMLPGAQINSTSASGYATGVELNNDYYSFDGALNQVTMNQAAILAEVTAGTAIGIYSGYPDNYNSSNEVITTQITLDNNSSITATAGGTNGYSYAAGIYLAYGNGSRSVIELNHGSSIVARTTVTAADGDSAESVARGIRIYDQEDALIVLDNSSGIEVTSTAVAAGTGTASVYDTYGIYAKSGYDGDSVVTMNNGSSITATAVATANQYAYIGDRYSNTDPFNDKIGGNSGIKVWNDYDGDARVYLANASSIINLSTATVNHTATTNSTTARVTDSFGIYAASDYYYDYYYAGNSSVSLDSGSTINIEAVATNNNLGDSNYDRAYATNIFGINADSYYGAGTVTLDNLSGVTVTSSATAQDNARAEAVGVQVGAYYDATVTMARGSQITATANATTQGGFSWNGASSQTQGIDTYSQDGNSSVLLDNSSVDTTAESTITVAAADYSYNSLAEARAYGIHAGANSGDSTITLNNLSAVTVTAIGTNDSSAGVGGSNGNDARANAYGIEAYNSWFGLASVSLGNASVSTTATATAMGNASSFMNGTNAYAYGINAESRSGQANVDLFSSTVTINATTLGDAETFAYGTGIEASNYKYSSSSTAGSTVSLDASSVAVTTTATSTGAGGDINPYARTGAAGIYAQTNGYNYNAEVTLSNLSQVAADATATAAAGQAEADANGIYAKARYSEANITVSLNSSVDATATATSTSTEYGNASASASGLYANGAEGAAVALTNNSTLTGRATATSEASAARANAYGIELSVGNTSTVTLDNATITTTATATAPMNALPPVGPDAVRPERFDSGAQAEASGISATNRSFGVASIGVNLVNSTVSSSASALGYYGYALANGIATNNNYGTGSTTITLDNSSVSAMADATYKTTATGITADYGDITINLLNGSSVSATASGFYSYAAGINLYGVNTASINIDAASSVSGSTYAILAQNTLNATVNNSGLIAGRVNVTDLNNQATGALQATLAENDSEWIDPLSATPLVGNYYFTAANTASLASGSTFRIATSDALGFTEVGQIKEYRLLGTALNGGAWDPATLSIVKAGYQSPLLRLEFSYSDPNDVETPGLSDADHYILRVEFLAPLQAGLTPNAARAAAAALADGLIDFNSDPEEWSPEIMSRVFGSMQFIHGNLSNIGNRLHGKKSGENSGNAAANNHLWVGANYTDATQDMRDSIEGFDSATMAFNLGYDRNLSANALLGLSFGYGNTEAETELSRRTQDMDEYMLSLYGQFKGQGWFGEGQLAAGWGSTDSVRNVGATLYTASFDSNSYYAKLVGGMNIAAGGWDLIPKASIDYANISFDDYREVGGPLALAVRSDTYDSSNLGAGLSVMNKGKMITPEFGAMVYYDLIGDTIQTSSRFTGGTTYFQTEGADPARLSWELNAGLTFEAPGTPLTFKVSYDLLGREDFMSHNFNGKLTFDF